MLFLCPKQINKTLIQSMVMGNLNKSKETTPTTTTVLKVAPQRTIFHKNWNPLLLLIKLSKEVFLDYQFFMITKVIWNFFWSFIFFPYWKVKIIQRDPKLFKTFPPQNLLNDFWKVIFWKNFRVTLILFTFQNIKNWMDKKNFGSPFLTKKILVA